MIVVELLSVVIDKIRRSVIFEFLLVEVFEQGKQLTPRTCLKQQVCSSLVLHMVSRVYIETTIPSFYHEVRTDPDMIARRDWTRQWWDSKHTDYELVTSEAVIDELEKGNFSQRENCLALVENVPLLDIGEEIADIVTAYIQHQVMPADPAGDALHLAITSFHKCDFLLTWNCRHLANANKFAHIRRVNTILGLFVPSLVTPLELLGTADLL